MKRIYEIIIGIGFILMSVLLTVFIIAGVIATGVHFIGWLESIPISAPVVTMVLFGFALLVWWEIYINNK